MNRHRFFLKRWVKTKKTYSFHGFHDSFIENNICKHKWNELEFFRLPFFLFLQIIFDLTDFNFNWPNLWLFLSSSNAQKWERAQKCWLSLLWKLSQFVEFNSGFRVNYLLNRSESDSALIEQISGRLICEILYVNRWKIVLIQWSENSMRNVKCFSNYFVFIKHNFVHKYPTTIEAIALNKMIVNATK